MAVGEVLDQGSVGSHDEVVDGDDGDSGEVLLPFWLHAHKWTQINDELVCPKSNGDAGQRGIQ